MCKVYTGYCGTSEIEHGCVSVRSLKLGDYLSVQAHKLCSISHLNECFRQSDNTMWLLSILSVLLLLWYMYTVNFGKLFRDEIHVYENQRTNCL